MRSTKRRALLVIAGAALAAAIPATTLASTELNVCTWLKQAVGDAVGTTSAAPGAVLGPNNGARPGGDKGPFPIFFTTSSQALLPSSTTGGGCS